MNANIYIGRKKTLLFPLASFFSCVLSGGVKGTGCQGYGFLDTFSGTCQGDGFLDMNQEDENRRDETLDI